MDKDTVLKNLTDFLANNEVALAFYAKCAIVAHDANAPHNAERDALVAIHTMWNVA